MGPRVVLARTPRYLARLRPTFCVLRPPAVVVRLAVRVVAAVRRLFSICVPRRLAILAVGGPRGPPLGGVIFSG